MDNARIMVVEDEFVIAADLVAMLRRMGHTVPPPISRGEDVLELARENKPDLILMDVMLGGRMNGLEAAELVFSELGVPVVFITAFADQATIDGAKTSHPYGYLIKPFDLNDLRAAVEMALARAAKDQRVLRRTASYRWLVENISHGVYVLDHEYHCLLINQPGAAFFGVEREALLGRDIRKAFPGLEQTDTFKAYRRVMHQRQPAKAIEEFERPGGGEGWLEIMISPVDEGIICVSQDITERVQADARKQRDRDLLEERVAERTAELLEANRALQEEIAERRRAQQLLSETTRTLDQIIRSAPLAIIAVDPQGLVTGWSPAAEKIFGWREQEVMGTFCPVFQEEDRGKFFDTMETIRHGGAPHWEEAVRVCKDGSLVQVAITSAPLKNNGGDYQGALAIVEDITERKTAVDALRESEERYRQIFETNQAVKLILDPETGDIVDANQAACDFYGYDRDRLLSINITDINVPSKVKTKDSFFSPDDDERDFLRFRHRLASGDIRDVEVYTGPIRAGGRTLMYSIIHDVTERIRAEAALRSSEETSRALLNANTEAAILVDRRLRTIAANHQAMQCLHASADNLLGRDLSEFLTPHLKDLLETNSTSIFNTGEPIYFEDHAEQRIIARHFFPVKDLNGKVQRLAIFSRDITESRRTEEKLRRYRDQLRSLASALSVAEERERHVIAGDLHDRVSQTLALAEIMLSRSRAAIEDQKLSDKLVQVQDLIQQAAADTRSLTIEISPPALHQLGLAAAVDELAEHLQKIHGTPIRVLEDSGHVDLGIDTSAALYRCVRELMINALKHSEAGQITVTFTTAEAGLYISVADDGLGFNPDSLVPAADAEGHFGLLSVHERMEHLGGVVDVVSSPGQGSKITIWMPVDDDNLASRALPSA